MNNEKAEGTWSEIKGNIQSAWGKLTHDDLERTKGNVTAIAGLIKQHYGEAKEDVTKKLNDLMGTGTKAVADKTEEAKDQLSNTRPTNA